MPRFEITTFIREVRYVDGAKDAQDALEQAKAMTEPSHRFTSDPQVRQQEEQVLPEGVTIGSTEEAEMPAMKALFRLDLTEEDAARRQLLLEDTYAYLRRERHDFNCGQARKVIRNGQVTIEPLDLADKVEAYVKKRAEELNLPL